MSRVLLADDSPHAQRIGERILREEGFEVVSVTDGETALVRLEDADPDLVLADASLPLRSGYELCRLVKNHPRFVHSRVILTAGALEPLDEEEARRVRADGILRKPFEASAVLSMVKPLVEAARAARASALEEPAVERAGAAAPDPVTVERPEKPPEADPERVRAAVTLALDAALPAMIDEITGKVLIALKS